LEDNGWRDDRIEALELEAERLRTARRIAERYAHCDANNNFIKAVRDEFIAEFYTDDDSIWEEDALAGTEANVDRLTEVIEREGWEDTKR
jgi:hypothetical protein